MVASSPIHSRSNPKSFQAKLFFRSNNSGADVRAPITSPRAELDFSPSPGLAGCARGGQHNADPTEHRRGMGLAMTQKWPLMSVCNCAIRLPGPERQRIGERLTR